MTDRAFGCVQNVAIMFGATILSIAARMTETPQRTQQERDIRTAKSSKQRVADLKAKCRPHFSPADIAKADGETRHTLDMAEIER